MLACSFYKTGGFNPRFSSIEVKTDIGNRPIAYHFKACSDCSQYYCQQFCLTGAIEVLS